MYLLTNEKPLQTLPELACMIGLGEALILQQLHFRLMKQTVTHNGAVWYCQSYDKWHQQFPFFSLTKIKRILLKLEELQLVHSTDKLNNFYVDRTKWYTINYDNLNELIQRYNAQSILEKEQIFMTASRPTSEPLNKPMRHINKLQNEKLAKQIDEVLLYLNERTGKRFSLKSQASRKFISGRLKEGFSVSDCKLVIDEQVACWKNHEMEKYLRPMTLFRPANFESYLNNALSKQQPSTVPKAVVLNFSAGEDL